jgi:hypothetical protein
MTPNKKRVTAKAHAKLGDLNPRKNPKGGAGNNYVPKINSLSRPNMLNPQPLPP